jgi:hypothetical protein
MSHGSGKKNREDTQKILHSRDILLQNEKAETGATPRIIEL